VLNPFAVKYVGSNWTAPPFNRGLFLILLFLDFDLIFLIGLDFTFRFRFIFNAPCHLSYIIIIIKKFNNFNKFYTNTKLVFSNIFFFSILYGLIFFNASINVTHSILPISDIWKKLFLSISISFPNVSLASAI
jgi:hypothetical protein